MIPIIMIVTVGTIFLLGALAGGSLQGHWADRRRRHARAFQHTPVRHYYEDPPDSTTEPRAVANAFLN